MEQISSLGALERLNRWIQESIMVKLLSIGFLILILLIPSGWIVDLMHERQHRAEAVSDEIAGKWSDAQTVSGPMLVIPYRIQHTVDKGDDGTEIREVSAQAFFLPEELAVDATLRPERLHRGIFEAVVYESSIRMNATFAQPDFAALNIDDAMVRWEDAYLVMGITDLRGIGETPAVRVKGDTLPAEPSRNIGVSIRPTEARTERAAGLMPSPPTTTATGVTAPLPLKDATSFAGSVTIDLQLKGSRRLDFIPAGKTTTVKARGAWSAPSFDGAFLPESREITAEGFTANWKVLHFNRPFAQQWTGEGELLEGGDFGVRLLIPVEQYQKSVRTAKYGVLIILLTFMALFLVEITQKVRVHPFQYILIGFALIIYYSLLLSFSEQVGYNIAYVIASVATVVLITLYARTFFAGRLAGLLSVLLIIFYVFIYVIIQQEDLSLLIGSVGLFLIVAALMYFSRNVRYYHEVDLPAKHA